MSSLIVSGLEFWKAKVGKRRTFSLRARMYQTNPELSTLGALADTRKSVDPG
jgi:hypothetical protein